MKKEKEKLIIKKFAGIDYIELDVNTINIIIGPQASGKSIIAKLLYYFKSFYARIKLGILDNKTKKQIDKEHRDTFITYFPKDTWSDDEFEINYQINETKFIIKKSVGEKIIKFEYSDNVKRLINESRKLYKQIAKKQKELKRPLQLIISVEFSEEFDNLIKKHISTVSKYNQIFIPAGRSFFSNIESSIFTFLSTKKALDPFLIEFGSTYESIKRLFGDNFFKNTKQMTGLDKIIKSILNSEYLREKEKDFLIHSDNRKVKLFNASSGQQEILPLLIILKFLLNENLFPEQKNTVLYIEEPEAHLFPNAQKDIVKILAKIFNLKEKKFQYVITTHSPYILSSFNNLMYAGYLKHILKEKDKKKLYNIIKKDELLDSDSVSAFTLKSDNKLYSIINNENKLIDQNILDMVSNIISEEFSKLMALDE